MLVQVSVPSANLRCKVSPLRCLFLTTFGHPLQVLQAPTSAHVSKVTPAATASLAFAAISCLVHLSALYSFKQTQSYVNTQPILLHTP